MECKTITIIRTIVAGILVSLIGSFGLFVFTAPEKSVHAETGDITLILGAYTTPREVYKEIIPLFHAVKMGFLTNILNPKATLFFLALFTQVLNPETPFTIKLFFGMEVMCISISWFSLLSFLVTTRHIQGSISKVQHHVEHAMGAVLIALGIKVAFFSNR